MSLDTPLAVVYCRVSTEDQETNGTSLDTQEETCRAYAEANGYTVLRVIREARSGATLARPGLDTLRDLVALRQVQAVIITEQDRLSRSLSDTYVLVDEFEAAGVALHFVTEPTDPSPEGKMMFGMKGLFKEYERSKTMDRTRRGKLRRAHEQSVQPAPRGTYGYTYTKTDKGGRYVVEPYQAAVVDTIYESLVGQASTLDAIVAKLNESGVPTPRAHHKEA